jgi:hypothetical protein
MRYEIIGGAPRLFEVCGLYFSEFETASRIKLTFQNHCGNLILKGEGGGKRLTFSVFIHLNLYG